MMCSVLFDKYVFGINTPRITKLRAYLSICMPVMLGLMCCWDHSGPCAFVSFGSIKPFISCGEYLVFAMVNIVDTV